MAAIWVPDSTIEKFRSYTFKNQNKQVKSSQEWLIKYCHFTPKSSILLYINECLYQNFWNLPFCRLQSSAKFFQNCLVSMWERVNADLRKLVSWLNASKISLNTSKTEFVIFWSPWKRLDYIPRLELSGQIFKQANGSSI